MLTQDEIKPGDFVRIYKGRSVNIVSRRYSDDDYYEAGETITLKDVMLVIATHKLKLEFDVLVLWGDNLGWIYGGLLDRVTEEIVSCHS